MKKRQIKKLWASYFKPAGMRTVSREVALPKRLVGWFQKKIAEAMASR